MVSVDFVRPLSDRSFVIDLVERSLSDERRGELRVIPVLLQCFFFQAEDGIRDSSVTGVQTCALPISLILAGNLYEYMTLQYDGGGNFRVEQVTPATAQQLGLAGTSGLSRWSFPSVSAYSAGVSDNGAAISAYHSPPGYLTRTLPSVP